MYRRILLAYDGSDSGQKALLDAKDLANLTQPKPDLFLVAVRPPPAALIGGESGIYDPELEKEEERQFRAILDDGLKRLADAGYDAKGELLVGDPVAEITRYAGEIKADLLVVGHRHRASWAARWWRGSVSKTLTEHSPCSLLVVMTK